MAINARPKVSTPLSLLVALGLMLWGAGCAGSHENQSLSAGTAGAFAPLPPAFLTGPASVLLTNAAGFKAHILTSAEIATSQEKNIAGELFGQSGKLLFAAEPKKSGRQRWVGNFSFIWDVTQSRGFILSEALQAYAPISASVTPTNVIYETATSNVEKVAGQICQQAQAIVEMSDGSRHAFQVLRALDSKFPVQIQSLSNAAPLLLKFSNLRRQPQPAELFSPPGGFTRYSSSEAMMTELVIREHNLRPARATATEPTPLYQQPR